MELPDKTANIKTLQKFLFYRALKDIQTAE
jgi:hypothetical protein